MLQISTLMKIFAVFCKEKKVDLYMMPNCVPGYPQSKHFLSENNDQISEYGGSVSEWEMGKSKEKEVEADLPFTAIL